MLAIGCIFVFAVLSLGAAPDLCLLPGLTFEELLLSFLLLVRSVCELLLRVICSRL